MARVGHANLSICDRSDHPSGHPDGADPAAEAKAYPDPANANPTLTTYHYTLNQPLTQTDPTGLDPCGPDDYSGCGITSRVEAYAVCAKYNCLANVDYRHQPKDPWGFAKGFIESLIASPGTYSLMTINEAITGVDSLDSLISQTGVNVDTCAYAYGEEQGRLSFDRRLRGTYHQFGIDRSDIQFRQPSQRVDGFPQAAWVG